MPKRYRYFCLFLSILVTLTLAQPIQAAERIYLSYGILGRSFTVTDLETFAKTGEATQTLGYFLQRFSPERQAQFQEALQARFPVEAVMFDRFAYTAPGERLLQEVGEIVQSPARRNGFQGLRSAMVAAADSPTGVSILNFLRQFPTDIRINVRQLLVLGRRVARIIQETKDTVMALNQQTQQMAAQAPIMNLDQWLDLRQPGSWSYQKQTLDFYDSARNRGFAADLYLPELPEPPEPQDRVPVQAPMPVIVMSNGLGAGRDRYEEIASHLASYGFAVVAPDHPGSDRQRLREFYAGLHRENFDASEYLDRPKDITFLLNELERINPTLSHSLNLQQVGIFGYSFGGSTALSLAGAEIDFDFLEQDCRTETGLVNISLLYQCRALELPRLELPRLELPTTSGTLKDESPKDEPLKDERIKAAFLFVPFGKSLFGQTGMAQVNIPIFWEVTDLDVLTPLVVEQVPGFAALTVPDKYFAVTQGLPHARVTYDAIGKMSGNTATWAELKAIAVNYQNALCVAFFKTYIAQDPAYRDYLQPAYANVLSQTPYHLSVVQEISPELSSSKS